MGRTLRGKFGTRGPQTIDGKIVVISTPGFFPANSQIFFSAAVLAVI